MHSKTKIIVLHMKEIIYTALFILFLIILAVLLFFMFGSRKSKEETASSDALYTAGTYTSSVSMDQTNLEVEVTVDEDHIKSIRFSNLDETVETMYPLLQSSMENLADQIVLSQSAEDITLPEDSEYTSSLILSAIQSALEKAADK